MRIAVTADVHLKETREQSPNRFAVLEQICTDMQEQDISVLIIAGDLFDQECRNYSQFEDICLAYEGLHFLVIPGNHDPGLSSKHFRADNLQVFDQPETKQFAHGPAFLFVPYMSDVSMGEVIADQIEDSADRWILVGHGDYTRGQRLDEPHETGMYMPINNSDLQRFDPELAVLGHIHKRQTTDRVHYPGSPQGLDINETGPRFYTVIDTQTVTLEDRPTDADPVFYNEHITTLPLANESAYIEKQISAMRKRWTVSPDQLENVKLRLSVGGFTQNMEQLNETITAELAHEITLYEDSPDLSAVQIMQDREREQIVKATKKHIDENQQMIKNKGLHAQDVVEEALEIILT